MVELTVGLPLYKATDIAWLALESLCQQKDVDFDWELLVMEELEDEAFGSGRISEEFGERLGDVGCMWVRHETLAEWLPLPQKWKQMGERAAKSSQCFLLQAADCYAHPWRLSKTRDVFRDDSCHWYQQKRGAFYDIPTGRTALFEWKPGGHPCALNMAVATHLMRNLPKDGRESSVDYWLHCQCVNQVGEVKTYLDENPDFWPHGLDTHGKNNISARHGVFDPHEKDMWVGERADYVLKNIPDDVMERLRGLKR